MSIEKSKSNVTDLEFEFTGLGKTQKAVLNQSEEFQIYGLNKNTEIGENLFFMIEQIKQLKNMNIDLVDNKGNAIVLPHEDASAIETVIRRIRSSNVPKKDEVQELDDIIPVVVDFFINNPDYIYFDENIVTQALAPIDENISEVSEKVNQKSEQALSDSETKNEQEEQEEEKELTASAIRDSFTKEINNTTRQALQDIPDSYKESKELADTQRTKRMTSIDKTLESLLNILPQQEDATLHAEFDEAHVSLTKDILKTIEYINSVDKKEFETRNPGRSYEETLKKVNTIQKQTIGIKKQVELNDRFNKGLQDQIDIRLGETSNAAKNIKELQQKLQAYANSASHLRMSVSIAQKTIDTIQLYYLELIYLYIQSYIDYITYNNEAVPILPIKKDNKEIEEEQETDIKEQIKQAVETSKEESKQAIDEGETMLHLKTPNIDGDHKAIQKYIEYFIYSVNVYMEKLSTIFPEARNSQIKTVNLEELAQKNINCFLIVTPYQESTHADLKILEETQKQSLAILEEAQANTSLVFKPVPKKVQPIFKKESTKETLENQKTKEKEQEPKQEPKQLYHNSEAVIEAEITELPKTDEEKKKDKKNKEMIQAMRGGVTALSEEESTNVQEDETIINA
jgi:hypothetical protein